MGSVVPQHVGPAVPECNRTHVPCITRQILYQWTTRKVPILLIVEIAFLSKLSLVLMLFSSIWILFGDKLGINHPHFVAPPLCSQSVAPLPLGRSLQPSSLPRACPALVSRADCFICTSSLMPLGLASVISVPGVFLFRPLSCANVTSHVKVPQVSRRGGIARLLRASGTKASTEGAVHNVLSFRLSFRLFHPCWSGRVPEVSNYIRIQRCTPKV